MLTAVAFHERGLRHGADQILDRGARTIGIQLGDEFSDKDDDHQHRAGNGLAAEHSDERGDGDENLSADFVLFEEIDNTFFVSVLFIYCVSLKIKVCNWLSNRFA